MKKLLAAIFLLAAYPAWAQTVTNPAPVAGSGAYNASPIVCTNGQFCLNQVDVLGNLKTVLSSGGSTASISLDGALNVNVPASPQFADTFSAALDTTTNWTAKNSTGTAATSAGQLIINSSTTASAWGGVSSQQSFAPVGISPQTWGVLTSFTVIAQANSTRVFGVFTVPATPTTAVPVTDGYIYRLDGTGALFAEIWSAGVSVSSTNVTSLCLPAANTPAIFAITYRASLVQFICGTSTAASVAIVPGINPVQQVLPVSALSIAGSTPPAASAVMNLSAISLAAGAPGAVKSANQAPTINDPYMVVGISPNAPLTVTSTTNAPVAPATATATNSTLTGCQATSAGITPTTGQQAAVDCDLNNNLLVSSGGAPNLLTAQVSVATSDTAVVAARALRRSVTIQQITGTQNVFCSNTTATTANGVLIPGVIGASVTLNTTAAIRCIAVTGAQTVAVVETY